MADNLSIDRRMSALLVMDFQTLILENYAADAKALLNRTATQETSDVLTPYRRQMLAEARFVHLQETVPMVAFLPSHPLEHSRRVG